MTIFLRSIKNQIKRIATHISRRTLLVCLLFLLTFEAVSQQCASQAILNQKVAENDRISTYRYDLEQRIQRLIDEEESGVLYRDVLSIDVVVHVVWKEAEEMISEEQVMSQIEVLNEDFRQLNASLDLVTFPPFQGLVADMEIEFNLATVDPAGNPTSGINYVETDVTSIAGQYAAGKRRICHSDLGGADAWCYHNYLNVWVGAYEGGVLGEASFPGQELENPEEDGIRVSYAAFGRTPNLEQPYNLGRTLTHEIGHYFNLFHPWGQSDEDPPNLDCMDDDGIADTPKQAFTYKNTCFQNVQQSCGTPDMHYNFMNYTDDACMAMFTLGQKERVVATILTERPGLLEPAGCSVSTNEPSWIEDILLLPNPVTDQLQIVIHDVLNGQFSMKIKDLGGQEVYGKTSLMNGINIISLGNLKNGFYLVTISDQEYFLTKKIVVIK